MTRATNLDASLFYYHLAMVVAVVFVRIVQVAVDDIIHVAAVRNLLMAATRTVPVRRVVARTGVRGRAIARIPDAHLDLVFVDVIAVLAVQMPVMQVVDVVPVLDGRMPAPLAVDVRVGLMDCAALFQDIPPTIKR
jgi:hypothetical protein